uniref:Uncharacterized protein n=1 Tax=Rhizophora mucronata TaxID=61149 RepID=A0A2P2PN16_RHIMU
MLTNKDNFNIDHRSNLSYSGSLYPRQTQSMNINTQRARLSSCNTHLCVKTRFGVVPIEIHNMVGIQ